ncbi:ROK family glucokinase [Facklamia lactis]|uniref:ROK family glucokinase n=1 Tax=Facklamia lactis TaxID=2749967 RepID=UPI0018CCBD15|nr:ROK family glucokinase [Facklamia lactis]MBG9980066.1 ROK family glucokinase [Facklamia lactis]
MVKEKIIAIDLGGTSAKLALVSKTGSIIYQWALPTDSSEEGLYIVPNLIQSIQSELKSRNESINEFLGIGFGTPGTVQENGSVVGAYNLGWQRAHPVKEYFDQAFDIPFYIENDANVAALGEQWQGAGKGFQDVGMLTLGTGVGGGIVMNGKIITGSTGSAGEIGHITVDFTDDFLCTCGKHGCLESVASATGILNLAHHLATYYEGNSRLYQATIKDERLNAKMIIDAAKHGDDFARVVFEHFCRYLGLACSHLANILNPSVIVIGGGVSQAGDFLLNQILSEFEHFVFAPIRNKTKIQLAQLGNDAGVIGAASLVIQ